MTIFESSFKNIHLCWIIFNLKSIHMHFDGKMIFNTMIGALIGIIVFTILLETPTKKLAEKVPYNK